MTNESAGRRQRIMAIATAISLVVAVALFFVDPLIALGFIGGVITGAGMLSALVVVLNRVVVPPEERSTHPAPWIALHVVKFALAAGFAYVVIEIFTGDVFAFAGGYTTALTVLLVMVAGEPTLSSHLSGADGEPRSDTDPETAED